MELNKIPTPETDANSFWREGDQEYVRADFARKLERERNDATDELQETSKDYACLAELLDGHDATECRMNLERIIGDLERLTLT